MRFNFRKRIRIGPAVLELRHPWSDLVGRPVVALHMEREDAAAHLRQPGPWVRQLEQEEALAVTALVSPLLLDAGHATVEALRH